MPPGDPQVVLLRALHSRAHQDAGGLHQGEGGLEVRGDGAGPALLVDLHVGGAGGHGRDHPAGAHALRRPHPHRQEVRGVHHHDRRPLPSSAVVAHAIAYVIPIARIGSSFCKYESSEYFIAGPVATDQHSFV